MSSIQSSPYTPPQPMNESGATDKPGETEEEKKKKKKEEPPERKIGEDGAEYEKKEGAWVQVSEPASASDDKKIKY